MHKKVHWLVWCGMLVLASCRTTNQTEKMESGDTPQARSVYEQGEHIICHKGEISLSRVVRPLFADDFRLDSGVWENFENHESRLSVKYDQHQGIAGLILRRGIMGGQDTGFSLLSRSFDVTPNTSFQLTLSALGTLNMRSAANRQSPLSSAILWLDEQGNELETLLFDIDTRPDSPLRTTVMGLVPANVKRARIRLGCDVPDFQENDFVMFTRISFVGEARESRLWTTGGIISRPFRMTEQTFHVEWVAHLPRQTSVYFQISTAPDVRDAPGAWTPFQGPEHDPQRAFLKSGEHAFTMPKGHSWIRYQARLHGTGSQTPVLKAVYLGSQADGNWAGPDILPPVIQRSSPANAIGDSAPVTFTMQDDTVLDWRTFSLVLDGVDVTVHTRYGGNAAVFTPPSPLRYGLHTFRLNIADAAGNRASRSFPLRVGGHVQRLPVMVNSSGGLQINARPYFPIIAWDVWKSAFNNQSFDKAFRDLKNIGFNAACTPIASRGEDYDGFLRAADGNGVQLIVSGDGGPNSEDSERLLKDVANAQGHSSILGWYLAEQPSQRIAPWQLKSQAHTVREIDPMHLTFRSELASGDSLPGAEFAGTTEGLFPFIFPLRENSSRIPEVISILQAARKQEPKGVVIPVLQCFKGQGYPAYPTLQELRAMVWLCAIHGANGIGFFTYNTSGELQGMTAEPDVWKNVCRVVSELSRLQGVLTAVAVPQPPPPKILKGAELDLLGHPSISYLYKEIGNRRLLFCVNSTREPVEARFTLRDADQATVLFESRTINLVKDRLSDHFQPLAVHIYEVHRMFE